MIHSDALEGISTMGGDAAGDVWGCPDSGGVYDREGFHTRHLELCDGVGISRTLLSGHADVVYTWSAKILLIPFAADLRHRLALPCLRFSFLFPPLPLPLSFYHSSFRSDMSYISVSSARWQTYRGPCSLSSRGSGWFTKPSKATSIGNLFICTLSTGLWFA